MKENTMTKYLIGAGGWAYFQVPGLDPLVAYSKAFNFVEVNSTFYEIPTVKLVKSWRNRVPENFEFSIRCHRSLTHKLKLEPSEEAYKILNQMKTICQILRADVLHIQTPPKLKLNKPKIRSIRDFFQSAELKPIRVAWEIRQPESKRLPPNLISLMRDLDIIHCVDLSTQTPAYKSDIMYTRLFGKGRHNIYQFTDEELKEIDKKVSRGVHKKVILSFHGLRMYKDAARFKIYKHTGKFPPVTRSTGLSSLREVLVEDAEFPTTKRRLIQHQGWKVIDLTETKRIRACEILQKLPEKTYQSLEQVMSALERSIKMR
jgi:uncharacterized protein YecE (DUF72 family)